jgi:hypothetical protein
MTMLRNLEITETIVDENYHFISEEKHVGPIKYETGWVHKF